MNKKHQAILKLSVSGMLLALAYVLPFATGNIPEIGKMLSPMHIPILICGLLCGWQYGLIVGLTVPILRGLTVGPTIYPYAISMSIELAMYGLVSGLLVNRFKKAKMNDLLITYLSLTIAMILGRFAWGTARYVFSIFDQTLVFNFKIFLYDAFLNAWLAIILHLAIIPPLVIVINKLNIFQRKKI